MDSLVASTIASRYHILRLLGRGGMGAVYLAKHIHTGEHVAIKLLLAQVGATPQAIERFRREMRAPGRIKSDHVVRVTDADVAPELNGAPFLVMELLDGCDLDKPLRQHGRYQAEEVVWIFGQIARGLEKAHALGIIHRDLKPENLFLHRKEEVGLIVKILDFGIARLIEPQKLSVEEAKLTNTGAIVGTPMYLSPEQAKAETEQIGPASDIWGLGMIAFELLSGNPYWKAETFASLVGQIMFAPMPTASQRAPGLPPAFNEWFARSCDRNPVKRWPSVSAQAEGLAAALNVSANQLRILDAPISLRQTVDQLRPSEAYDEPEAEEGVDGDTRDKAFHVPSSNIRNAATRLVPERETVQRPRSSGTKMLLYIAGVGAILISSALLLGRGLPSGPRISSQPQPLVSSPLVAPGTAVPSPDLGTAPFITGNALSPQSTGPRPRTTGTRAPMNAPKSTTAPQKTATSSAPQLPRNKATQTASGYDPGGR